jgi:hypothetical protein
MECNHITNREAKALAGTIAILIFVSALWMLQKNRSPCGNHEHIPKGLQIDDNQYMNDIIHLSFKYLKTLV